MIAENRPSVERQFQSAEHRVELRSASLKKELRLADLVGMQILNVVSFAFIAGAGKVGSSHLVFWLAAVALFYIPSGIVVAHLAKEMPLEGGIYQWASLRLGPLAGFLVAMNIWLYNVLIISSISLSFLEIASYALGPGGAWLASSKPVILGISVVATCALMLVAWRGLVVGKWISNFGGFSFVCLFAAVIIVALARWLNGAAAVTPAAFTMPAVSLLSLNILGKMGFAALSGVDCVAVFAGECQSPDAAAIIRRSVWLAAPVIAGMMILATASLLVFVPPDAIVLIAPGVQVMSLGAPQFVKIMVALLILTLFAQKCLFFSVMVRLPMVAGWDHLLPAWFCRLDERYGTPVGSVLFAGAVIIAFALFANAGAGNQEAFQLIFSVGFICYACAYLVMFAIPLVTRGERPPWLVSLAALSGFLMTLLFVVLAVFPIIKVPHPGVFAAKIIAAIGALQCVGVAYYWRANRARSLQSTGAELG